MHESRPLLFGLCVFGMLLSGCQTMRRYGPMAPAVTACREYSQQGLIALEQEHWELAEQLFSKAVETCPDDVDARRHHAEALWNRGRRDEAVAQLERAIALDSENAGLRVRATAMRLAMGRVESARREIETALDIDPNLASAWAMRARVLRAAGDPARSMADYHRALGYLPDDRNLLLEMAELYRERNEPEKALALLHRLIDTYGPGEEPQKTLYLEGLAYAALGRLDEAAESLALASSRGEATPEVLYQLAMVRSRMGRTRDAVAAAEAALRLEPNHSPSLRLLDQMGVARAAEGSTRR
ncbi:MAG: tetratricopeptide repeat protein [Pirellulaceae bacterium]|nr:tetratricopeptide repeat protein [Pirellulaceae bacterium]